MGDEYERQQLNTHIISFENTRSHLDTDSITTRIWRMGEVLFSQVCVCPHRQRYPIPRLFPRSLVPGPFWVDTPVPDSFPGLWMNTPVPANGYPSPSWGDAPVLARGYPMTGACTPDQNRTGVPPPGHDWGTPCQGHHWGTSPPGHDLGTHSWAGLGYPPARTGLGYPLTGTGVPPTPPRQNSTVRTCYAVDGMPLAVTQEDFLVKTKCFILSSFENARNHVDSYIIKANYFNVSKLVSKRQEVILIRTLLKLLFYFS